MPEAAGVEADRVKKIISEMMRNFVGSSPDTEAAANSIASAILAKTAIDRPPKK
jgi:hypothetical protein